VSVLHLTNGSSLTSPIRAAGILGAILPWDDVLHEGPVRAGLNVAAMRETRAEFLASCGLDAEESNRALAEIGACAGSALLRVDRGAQHSSFAVTEPAGGRSTSPALPSRLPAPLLAS